MFSWSPFVVPRAGYNHFPSLDMQAGMQHPSLDGYEEVGVLGRG